MVPHGQRADKVLGLQLGEFLLVVSAWLFITSQTWGPGHESEATWGPSASFPVGEAEQAALAEGEHLWGSGLGQ